MFIWVKKYLGLLLSSKLAKNNKLLVRNQFREFFKEKVKSWTNIGYNKDIVVIMGGLTSLLIIDSNGD